MRHLVSIADLTNQEIEEIFALADSAEKLRAEKIALGRIMATLFYEPSTRTRLSFESAMQRLGGSVISCSDMNASSAAKGESVADTAHVVSSYADVLVIRHYWDGAVQAMAEHSTVPVINAGDGRHEHPTQTLCDLYTLRKERGRLRGLNVVICGDLKNGRTTHSLVYALARFGANVVLLAADGMELPQYVLERLEREHDYTLAQVASDDLRAVVSETDALYLTPKQPHQLALFTQMDSVVQSRLSTLVSGLRYDAFYMTRKQKERINEGATRRKYPTIGPEFLKERQFQDTVVMHPLPRVDELSPELDKDRRGIYFKQAAYGVPVRMALLSFLFDQVGKKKSRTRKVGDLYESPQPAGPVCVNANCITVTEPASTTTKFEIQGQGPGGALILRCHYCDNRSKVHFVGHIKSKRYCAYDSSLASTMREWLSRRELAVFESIKQAEELGYEPYKTGRPMTLMDETELEYAIQQMSREIANDCKEPDRLLLLGIRSKGSYIARRIAAVLERQERRKFEVAEIDIYSSGEEIRRVLPDDPDLGPVVLKQRAVVVIDDVIQTGRTAKHALDAIFRAGRPQSVRLAVLIDRGHREMPLKPDYVGKNIPSSERERVRVKLREVEHEKDQVIIYSVINPGED